jgi:CubicO group peptidase (beta-lactamase class C family)
MSSRIILIVALSLVATAVQAAGPISLFYLSQGKYNWNGVAVADSEIFTPAVSEDGSFTIPVTAPKDGRLPWTFEGAFSPEPIELGKARGLSFTGPDAKTLALVSPNNGVGVANSFYFPLTSKMKTLTFQIAGTNSFSGAYAELLIDGKSMFRQSPESIARFTQISWDVSKYVDDRLPKLAQVRLVDKVSTAVLLSANRAWLTRPNLVSFSTPKLIWNNVGSFQTGVQSAISDYRKREAVPGVWALALKNGRCVALSAEGLRNVNDASSKASVNDFIPLGSISKSVTASLIGVLLDQGVLRWDMRISEVFTEFKGFSGGSATIEQLLSHMSGIARAQDLYWDDAKGYDWRYKYMKKAISLSPMSAPGEEYNYSDGVIFAVSMAEKITGASFESLLEKYLFTPLGIKEFYIGNPENLSALTSPSGHYLSKTGGTPIYRRASPFLHQANPAGGICLRLIDVAKYIDYVSRGQFTQGFPGSPKMLKYLLSNMAGNQDMTRGAWFGDQTRDWLHNSGNTGRGESCVSYFEPQTGRGLFIYVNANFEDGGYGPKDLLIWMTKALNAI